MPSIFLSHANADVELATATREYLLELDGLDVRLMSKDIQSDVDWADFIWRSLDACDHYLFLVTPNFVGRPWFHIEWSAAALLARDDAENHRMRHVHLLLIDVAQSELPDVMQQRQVISIELANSELAEKLIAPIAGVAADSLSADAQTIARKIRQKALTERRAWAEAKWVRVRDAVAEGRAVLPEEDLRWVVDERLDDLLEHLRRFFAHPTLVRQVAQFLAPNRPDKAALLVDLVGADEQTAIFRSFLSAGQVHEAERVVRLVSARSALTTCASIAIEMEEYPLAEFIGQIVEPAADKRKIALQLLAASEDERALAVMERADKNYEKRIFAEQALHRGSLGVVRGVVDSMTVSKELRHVAEYLMAAGQLGEFEHALERIDKSYDKRELAIRALGDGHGDQPQEDYFRSVVESMPLSRELRRVAEKAYERGQIALAVWVVQFIDVGTERREFAKFLVAQGDVHRAIRAAVGLTSRGIRAIIEVLCEVGHEDEALALVAECKKDEERELLAWYAMRTGQVALAQAVLDTIRNAETRGRLTAVLGAVENTPAEPPTGCS